MNNPFRRLLALLLTLCMILSLSLTSAFADELDIMPGDSSTVEPAPNEPPTEEPPVVSNPKLDKKSVTLNIHGHYKWGDYYEFYEPDLVLTGYNDPDSVTFTSSSENLRLDSYYGWYDDSYHCRFSPKKTGTYTVTVQADGKTLTCKVQVVNAYFVRNAKTVGDAGSKDWMEYDSTLALYTGESTTLTVKGFPSGSAVKWSTSDKTVATVTNGKVTAKQPGSAVITASCNGIKLTYPVAVSSKTAITALRYCIKNYNSKYSQPKRMKKGYYDCSSFVWRAYQSTKFYVGSSKTNAPTAADMAKWCVNNNYMIYEGTVSLSDLLPGDLIFETGENNGRYKGIYHVDMYQGNGKLITVARTKNYWVDGTLSQVMVARPCTTKLSKLGAVKESSSATKLTWTAAYKPSGYQVYRSKKKSSGFAKLGTTKGTVLTYSDKTNHKTTYYYKVRPYWTKNKHTYYGKWSDTVKFK